jgi:hypothetical protein
LINRKIIMSSRYPTITLSSVKKVTYKCTRTEAATPA